MITDTALLSATAQMMATSELTTTGITTAALGALTGFSGDLLSAINLNTIGYELDRTLAPLGLQLRQGDLYLNRLGAQKLGANVGDVLEIYIGPLPVRFRVRAVVDDAGPLSSVLPVVMLRLDEAQKLLFMEDKVNAVLVSNLGDELTGMQHTDAVSKRLAMLALDDDAVQSIAEIVRQPDANQELRDLAASLPDSPTVTVDDEAEMPPLLAGIFNSVLQSFNLQQMSKQEANLLLDAVAAGDDAQLRSALARSTVREWLATASLTPELSGKLATAVANLNQFEQIEPLNKTTIVAAANVGGGVFSSIFSIFGIFSILAGLLLIVLIVVMLAAERRVEIGVARAVGVQRRQIVQMFMVEGMVYNLLAAALGVLLGIGITCAMTTFIGRLCNDVTGQLSEQAGGIFTVGFAMSWESIVIAYCLGVLITWLAMTITTSRASRMNIVTAIRDLPDEAESKRRSRLGQIWSWLYPLLATGLGVYLLTVALDTHSMSLVLIATTFILYGLAVLTGRILELTPIRNETGYRIVYTMLGAGLILIWVLPWYQWAPQVYPDLFTWDPTQAPTVFTIGGPLIIIGAILIIMFNAGFLSSLFASLLGFIPALRPVLRDDHGNRRRHGRGHQHHAVPDPAKPTGNCRLRNAR
ncbi:MAG: FtsX-like permease family protein [Anaerolineales bacterium]|nr:FtsX-like permease family protein [Anaerolineales bacterium]